LPNGGELIIPKDLRLLNRDTTKRIKTILISGIENINIVIKKSFVLKDKNIEKIIEKRYQNENEDVINNTEKSD